MIYQLKTKVAVVNGNITSAAIEAGKIHERNLMGQIKSAIARFYQVSAEIADRERLIEFVPGSSYNVMRDRKSKRELIVLERAKLEECGNFVIISTAYTTWDDVK